eukprot:scaffold233809_cov44-Tisochrysis_lutea.AAC.1
MTILRHRLRALRSDLAAMTGPALKEVGSLQLHNRPVFVSLSNRCEVSYTSSPLPTAYTSCTRRLAAVDSFYTRRGLEVPHLSSRDELGETLCPRPLSGGLCEINLARSGAR